MSLWGRAPGGTAVQANLLFPTCVQTPVFDPLYGEQMTPPCGGLTPGRGPALLRMPTPLCTNPPHPTLVDKLFFQKAGSLDCFLLLRETAPGVAWSSASLVR